MLHESDGIETIQAWTNVLLPHRYNVEPFEVIRLVESLKSEIRRAERQLSAASVPASLYQSHFEKAYHATNVNNLSSPWANLKQYITAELLVCFAFAAHLIDEDEPEFEEEELSDLEGMVSDLEETISASDIDSELKHFAQQQISLLRRGLEDVRIRGAKAIQKCYVDGLGDIVENAETIKNNSESRVVDKLRTIWTRMRSMTEKAAALNKSTDTWSKVIDKGSALLEHLSNL